MTGYLYLAIAIVAEVIATTSLKASEGFTRLWPSVMVVIGYAISFFMLSLVVRSLSLGTVYAIWSGVGIVLVSLAGLIIYKQKLDLPAIAGIALIFSGVVLINLSSKTVIH